MRVLFSSIRGPGHYQPLVPFIEACRRRGHDVVVAAPEDLRATVERAGFAFWPFGHPGDDALREVWKRLPGLPPNEASKLVVGEIFANLNARAALPGLCAAIDAMRPDLIVREAGELGSPVAAALRGIPIAHVAISLGVSEEELLGFAIENVDRHRVSEGLAADGGAALRAAPRFSAMPRSLEDPSDPGPATLLRVRAPRDETPCEPLPAWWGDDTRPLVYVTFGSIAGGMASSQGVYKIALDAIADLPVRALLTTGRGFDAKSLGVVPPNAHVEAWVPQRDVLPHVAAIVCHVGSGTMLGALEAGLPIVAVPLFADQPANAIRIAAVGAGVMVDGKTATPEALRDAIANVLADEGPRRVAQAIAAEIAALPTTDAAVDAFEAFVARR